MGRKDLVAGDEGAFIPLHWLASWLAGWLDARGFGRFICHVDILEKFHYSVTRWSLFPKYSPPCSTEIHIDIPISPCVCSSIRTAGSKNRKAMNTPKRPKPKPEDIAFLERGKGLRRRSLWLCYLLGNVEPKRLYPV